MTNKISLTVNESPEALEAELVEALRKGVVEFYYKKGSTGELRVAHGMVCGSISAFSEIFARIKSAMGRSEKVMVVVRERWEK